MKLLKVLSTAAVLHADIKAWFVDTYIPKEQATAISSVLHFLWVLQEEGFSFH